MYQRPILLALLSAALFGAATPASKVLLMGFTPFQLAGLLYLGAAAAVAPLALRHGGAALPGRGDHRNQIRLFGAILCGGILGPLALLFGLRVAEAASVSLWLNLELVATAVLGVLFFHDHLGYRGWLGVAAALIASLLVAWGPDRAGFLAGTLVLVACICWGLDNHLTALIDGITPTQSTFWKGLVAGSVNLAIGAAIAPLVADFGTVALALAVGALAYGASIVLYIQAAQDIGATRAQVLFASAPFFGVALSVLFLDENFSLAYVVATALFLLGIGLLMADGHAHDHDHRVTTHAHPHSHDDGHHTHTHEELPPSTRHTHEHTHVPQQHAHPHWPDMHHRHAHPPHESR
jgi:drug/metabolite transporter (DMT)-like permease